MSCGRCITRLLSLRLRVICLSLLLLGLLSMVYLGVDTSLSLISFKSHKTSRHTEQNLLEGDADPNEHDDEIDVPDDFMINKEGLIRQQRNDIPIYDRQEKEIQERNLDPDNQAVRADEDYAEDEIQSDLNQGKDERNINNDYQGKDERNINNDYFDTNHFHQNADSSVEKKSYSYQNSTAGKFLIPFVINEPFLCSQESIKLLILVHSLPKHKEHRDMVRQTWATITYHSYWHIRTVFILGIANSEAIQDEINEESRMHHDIVQFKFKDTLRMSATKSMYGLQWAQMNCEDTVFIAKVRDNVFVNVFQLVQFLQSIPKAEANDFIFCSLKKDNTLQIDSSTTKDLPIYCQGFAYVISNHIASVLTNNSSKTNWFWKDDIFVKGPLAEQLHPEHKRADEPNHSDKISRAYASSKVNTVLFLQAKYFLTSRTWAQVWAAARKYNNQV